MYTSNRAPKQRELTKSETIDSFEGWRHNLVYILKQSREFLPYVDAVWTRKSRLNPHRGFEDDDIDDLEVDDTAQTAAQKSAIVEDMLGMVANHCHIISRRSILEATSLADVWHKIRLHFNFQAAGSRFLDICKIRQEADERPEDLYQRISSFVYDNFVGLIAACR